MDAPNCGDYLTGTESALSLRAVHLPESHTTARVMLCGGGSAQASATGFAVPWALDARQDSSGPCFLAAPISYHGLLVQCVGRVLRAAPGKDQAEVNDYHDPAVPILAASLQRRMPGYRALRFTREP